MPRIFNRVLGGLLLAICLSGPVSAQRALSTGDIWDMEYDPVRELLYVSDDRGLILRWDPYDRVFLSPIQVGGTPRGISLSPDGSALFVAQSVYQTHIPEGGTEPVQYGHIQRIDPDTLAITDLEFDLHDHLREGARAFDVLVTNEPTLMVSLNPYSTNNAAWYEISMDGETALYHNNSNYYTSSTTHGPTAIASESRRYISLNDRSQRTHLWDTAANGIVSTLLNVATEEVAIMEELRTLLVADFHNVRLYNFDTTLARDYRDLTGAARDVEGIVYDAPRQRLLVTSSYQNELFIIDPVRHERIATVALNHNINGTDDSLMTNHLRLSADGRFVFIALENTLLVYDLNDPVYVERGIQGQTLTTRVRVDDLDRAGLSVDFGPGIAVLGVTNFDDSHVNVRIRLDEEAPVGWHDVSVQSGSETRSWHRAFKVLPSVAGDARIFAAVLPSSRSGVVNQPITALAALVNPGPGTARNCRMSALNEPAVTLEHRPFHAERGMIQGESGDGPTIQPGESGHFFFTITSSQVFQPRDLEIEFRCDNASPAPIVTGLNTFLFSAYDVQYVDVLAIAATTSGDGIVHINPNTHVGAFAAAAINIGTPSTEIAVRVVQDPSLSLRLTICDSGNASHCASRNADNRTIFDGSRGAATFYIRVESDGTPIPRDLARSRITLEFLVANLVVGSTSVAVR